MKHVLILALATLSAQSSFAGFSHLKCEAYRISNDKNVNLQKLIIDDLTVNINGALLTEVLGTCSSENMSSCGGACEEESNQRDEL
jgi:hypothetical protein